MSARSPYRSGIHFFARLKSDAESAKQFKDYLHRRGFTLERISIALGLQKSAISNRLRLGIYFSQGEYERIKDTLNGTDEELQRYFRISMEGMEVIQRSGNGYKLDFKVNNETHLAYGKSEIECKQNAEKRKQELESKAEEAEESVKIVISKDDAMLLSFYLLKGIKEGKPTGEDKTTLTSIYMRIATALI